jgi:hypothetical protein
MVKHASLKAITFNDLACKYSTTNFQDALANFITQTNHPTTSGAALSQLAADTLIPFHSILVHHKIKFANSDNTIVDSIRIWPEQKDAHRHLIPSHFDTVLVCRKGRDGSLHSINGKLS